jgi:hypothetical protein
VGHDRYSNILMLRINSSSVCPPVSRLTAGIGSRFISAGKAWLSRPLVIENKRVFSAQYARTRAWVSAVSKLDTSRLH